MLGNFLPNVKLHVPITEILHLLNLIAVFTEMNKIFIIICGIVSEKGKKTPQNPKLRIIYDNQRKTSNWKTTLAMGNTSN